ncbi:hypothetical protein NHF48_009115 [Sphingomonas sp. H160509]|uniref:hypothetical protein n=1 Tax=Sphingomonas sp. H160509 TaxID=2955313 RepID=UPI002097CEFE|nr:hypothetical protein [Sphingomonas sp. H160509]MDD1451091.1 hypothetical protein [Sphingomonas sp. H160509]
MKFAVHSYPHHPTGSRNCCSIAPLERGAQDNVTVTIIGCEQATQIGALLLEI